MEVLIAPWLHYRTEIRGLISISPTATYQVSSALEVYQHFELFVLLFITGASRHEQVVPVHLYAGVVAFVEWDERFNSGFPINGDDPTRHRPIAAFEIFDIFSIALEI